MSSNIAISYRRQDSAGVAGRIFDRLTEHYGEKSVFMDIDSIPFGIDFQKHIAEVLSKVDILIVVMGPQWLVKDENGQSRIMHEGDPVRIELEIALQKNIPIIPVLVERAVMPGAIHLPDTMKDFVFRNAAEVDIGRDFHPHVDRLIRSMDRLFAAAHETSVIPVDNIDRRHVPNQQIARNKPSSATTTPAEPINEPVSHHTKEVASLATWIESVARNRGPVDLSLQALIAAFLLSLASQICGLGWLEYELPGGARKQVGFLFAPNWTIVYWGLFPPYLALFALLISRWRLALKDFCEERILLGADGTAVPIRSVLVAWNKAQQKVSLILWILLVVVVLQTFSEWIAFCYLPFTRRDIGAAGIDWSTLAIVDPQKANWWAALLFTSLAYVYMAFALFIYLAILMYAATLGLFLNRLSDQSGEYRLVLRSSMLIDHFTSIATTVYTCVLLGIGAAICMRSQAEYVKSGYALITDLWFSDVRSAFYWLRGEARAVPSPQPFQIPSEWTSFGEMIFTLFILFIVIYLMYDAFESARKYFLEHIPPGTVTKEVDKIRRWSFVRCVVPQYAHWTVILTGEVLTYFFVGYGTIGLVTLLYAFVQFAVFPAVARRRGDNLSDVELG